MGRKDKDITKEDAALWELATRDVAPMKDRARPAPPQDAAPRAKAAQSSAPAPVRLRPAAAAGPAPKGRELDLRTRQKLERGQMAIEAALDLHGFGREAARLMLIDFLQDAHRRRMRCVLVITGKGGAGVLRGSLPLWVREAPLAPIVLEATPSRRKHGGPGAFYILLRRDRSL